MKFNFNLILNNKRLYWWGTHISVFIVHQLVIIFLNSPLNLLQVFFFFLSKSINSSTIYLRLGLYNKEYLENYSPKGLRIRVPVSGGSSQLSWNLSLINRASSRPPVLNRQKYHSQTASYAYHSRQYKTWKIWTCLMICVTQLLVPSYLNSPCLLFVKCHLHDLTWTVEWSINIIKHSQGLANQNQLIQPHVMMISL